jgi:hypothetical protein
MKLFLKKSTILKILLLIFFLMYFSNNNEKTIFFYKNIKYKFKLSSIQIYESGSLTGVNIIKYIDNKKTISTTYAYSLEEFNEQSNSNFFFERIYYLDDRPLKHANNYFSSYNSDTLYFP